MLIENNSRKQQTKNNPIEQLSQINKTMFSLLFFLKYLIMYKIILVTNSKNHIPNNIGSTFKVQYSFTTSFSLKATKKVIIVVIIGIKNPNITLQHIKNLSYLLLFFISIFSIVSSFFEWLIKFLFLFNNIFSGNINIITNKIFLYRWNIFACFFF